MVNHNEFVFDVDQTLAGGIVRTHLTFYNERLNLGMSAQEIAAADGLYPSTLVVPQILNFIAQGESAKTLFESVRREIRTSREVHLGFIPIQDSQNGVKQLLHNGEMGGYYTVRPFEIEGTTKEWLKKERFPKPGKVIICSDPKTKLQLIVQQLIVPGRPDKQVVLIDDGLDKLVTAAQELAANQGDYKRLFERLVIVGFGQFEGGTIYPDIGLHIKTLPSWHRSNVNGLIQQLKY